MNKWLITASIALALSVAGVQAAGDAEAGKTKSAACTACHGPDGNSPNNPIWPKLAGQHPDYLEKQLMDFKSGDRKDPTMIGMVAPLNEQDMADLAAYFATQPKQGGGAAEDKVELGEKLYRAGRFRQSRGQLPCPGRPACRLCGEGLEGLSLREP
jgi:cytochrome c553